MFRILTMRAAQNKMIYLKIRLINMHIFNKAKAFQKHLKNIQIWQKM